MILKNQNKEIILSVWGKIESGSLKKKSKKE
jgi:hypothetical protein